MDALLILGGVLMILSGLVLLVTLAFGTSLLWGLGSLIPPITLVYVVRYWKRARKALALAGMGCIPLVVGLVQLAQHDAERLQAIVSLDWLKSAPAVAPELNIRLYGELRGQPFAPTEGELIDGVLSLRERGDFFAKREVNIRLAQPASGELRVDVLPQDTGSLPEVEVVWLDAERDLPEARRLNRGYTLHLDLKPQAPNKLVGDFHLVMPSALRTALSGEVEVFTDRLRYHEGHVDRRHDSRDTLAWVIRDYLQRREQRADVSVSSLPPFTLPTPTLSLEVTARVGEQALTLPVQLRKHESRGWQVIGDNYPPLTEGTAVKPEPSVLLDTAASLDPSDRRITFSLQRLLREPQRYEQLSMRVQTHAGSVAEGRFTGLSPTGRLTLQRQVSGAGGASYRVKPEDVQLIELLEP